MKELFNEKLSKYTTIHIGGIARKMLIPESTSEILAIAQSEEKKFLLGGGSNLLISEKEFDVVVNLRSFDTSIENHGNGNFTVGGSVRLQKLIIDINEAGYGGIEYLYSVPGLVGGAVVMNAGGSKEQGWCISDYIKAVRVVCNGEIITLSKEECQFSHRNSIFKNNSEYIVISVDFVFPKQGIDESERKRKERMEFFARVQDNSEPNFGSVFSESNAYIMEIVRRISLGWKRGIHYSKKSGNWILNSGKGTYRKTMLLIKVVSTLHWILGKKCKTEVIIWK